MNIHDWNLIIQLIPKELWNTIYMVIVSSLLTCTFGIPLGILLTITSPNHIGENKNVYRFLSAFVNVGRSFPFIILMIAIIPFTRLIVGTSLGTTAAIVPLTIAAIPFLARVVEGILLEIDRHLIDAAKVMGSNQMQIITKVLIPESLPSLTLGITTTVINIISYSAMAGTMGGGGLGKIAIQYGYQRFNPFIIFVTVAILLLLVQLVQWLGNSISKKINAKRGV
ncbi:D-methionine transport system permease protein MetI [Candidatus Rubidus massiliensis]|nr:MAG: methionine ABC transporter permease [Chlamydia sp. 32-24]CDZ80074.1 D-methionine transport system permease protein MetI [Candidatus Rubidus massiliensis]